ncbi:nucleotidyltransferase domain-containing protein [Deinococcus cavernae]|uniref:Nucleotidyltransferase domain-containing protein n=1 Tax=Deinococcus cavernae TaxID=2320857 RepID=A0A418V4Y5_9DEIO|nr:nucleotidyltransferase domain-containing protein [Deinococcus cavernae]RJF71168.1 nucleotidyltransferase domain-containing protein [Deinococcus cavernae]
MTLPALAHELAAQLAHLPGVLGVALGGSYATGTATPESDLDLSLAYQGSFDLAALNALCQRLDDSGMAQASPIGGWGPWVDGGAWLTVRGQRVDFIYRDLGRVQQSVQDALAGQVALYTQPGHPHGIHAHHYAAELASCVILEDASGRLAELKRQVNHYPPALSLALRQHYGWQKEFWLAAAQKGLKKGDLHYAGGCAYQAAMAFIQELCAIHETWLLNEKVAALIAARLPGAPPHFAARLAAVLSPLDLNGLQKLLGEAELD